ncbi:MAG: cobaltochelatase CobT [Granulosicoccus sp.]
MLNEKVNKKGSSGAAGSKALELSSVAGCARSLAATATLNFLDAAPESVMARGLYDSVALKKAHHNEQMQLQFAPEHVLSRSLFSIIERERYEALGANQFVGVQQNLDARTGSVGADFVSMGGSDLTAGLNAGLGPSLGPSLGPATEKQLQAFTALMCRRAFRANEGGTDNHQIEINDQHVMLTLSQSKLNQLTSVLHDQNRFASLASSLADRLTTNLRGTGSLSAEPSEVSDEADEILPPDQTDEDSEPIELGESEASEDTDDSEELNVEGDSDGEPTDDLPEQAMDEAPISGPDPTIQISGDTQPYKVFTTDFDETGYASQWASNEQLAQWRIELDDHIATHGRLVRRLATRLERVLLAQQKRHWQFDLEEGQLDSARLSRIISDPLMPLSFKAESEMAFKGTTLTLLIDNSRSMLGKPIMIAAVAADILARTLERCGVTVEILGFTTCHLHGGLSTEAWERQGCPENPGRLNDLRHIIYKAADTPYRLARRSMGLMLDRDILKQNIDGEALTWAYQRLQKRSEQRRILMTISDGAPVDTSTLGTNAGDYLARHLQDVIDDIEGASGVELMAIGIGHDVGRFYSHAVSVFDARQLGPVMLDQLESLFRQSD